mgnify:CR=1 FL=1
MNNSSTSCAASAGVFSQHGEGRRAVLEALFVKGSKSSNPVAAAVAPGAQRAYQAMDRQRAFDLINQKTNAADEASVSTTSDDATATTAATSEESPVIVDAATNTADDEDLIAALRLRLELVLPHFDAVEVSSEPWGVPQNDI